MKHCTHCDRLLSLDKFYRLSGTSDRRRPRCKTCDNEQRRLRNKPYERSAPRCRRCHTITTEKRTCLACRRIERSEEYRPDAPVELSTKPLRTLMELTGIPVRELGKLYQARLNITDRTAWREWRIISNQPTVDIYIADRWCSVLGFPLGFIFGEEAYIGCEEETG